MNGLKTSLRYSTYLCSQCSKKEKDLFQKWISELVELPLIHNFWDVGLLISSLDHCPHCRDPYTIYPSKDEAQVYNLPFLLGIVTAEATVALSKTSASEVGAIPSILTESANKSYSSPVVLDVLSWLALAVASGIAGNLAYDTIEGTVIAVYNSIKDKRREGMGAEPNPFISKSEVDAYGSLFLEWDHYSEAELKERLFLLNQYLRQRLKHVCVNADQEKGVLNE